MRVRAPGVAIDEAERSLIRFSQVIMLCIAIGAIWFSIFRIAFDEDASNNDFAVLFFGGMLSAVLAIGWIEAQSRSNDHQLRDVQDYMLGIGFFFSTVGTVWGARFIIGLFEESGQFGQQVLEDSGAWYPNGNGVYVQTFALLGLMVIQYRILQHFKGQTTFGWAIASYAPMVVLLGAGMNTWLRWSGGIVSYELGISLIVLSVASMEMALRSNNSINLTVIVIASGIVPLLFEAAHSDGLLEASQKGGALSLLVFVIAIQGYYASKQELRTDIIQKASFVLITAIVFAMIYARADNLNLILGPLTSESLGGLSSYFSLGAVLWLAVLVFYFPAMLDQRLPWIPIGLAFALMILPNDESAIPWLITVAILPYMLLISKATRKWVANSTLAMTAVAYLIVDYMAWDQGILQSETFGFNGLHFLVPVALITISEFAQRRQKIDFQVHMLVIACVALSRAVVDSQEWYTTWVFIIYLLSLARLGYSRLNEDASLKQRWNASLTALLANAVMIALIVVDGFQVPEWVEFRGYEPHVFLIGLFAYLLLQNGRTKEMDLGMMFAWSGSKVSGAPIYDSKTNTWIQNTIEDLDETRFEDLYSWSPIARLSLLVPFIMMTYGMFIAQSFDTLEEAKNIVKAPYVLLLLAVPIAGLVWEILALERISSKARASAVWTLVAIAAPPALVFNRYRSEMIDDPLYIYKNILPGMMMLDLMLVIAPLIVAWAISRQGLDKNSLSEMADLSALMGLLALGLLDSSGGLLIVAMLALVTYQAAKYRQNLVLMVSPIILVFNSNRWVDWNGITRGLTDGIGESFTEPSWVLGLSALSGILIVVQMSYVLLAQFTARAAKSAKSLPWLGAWTWFVIGLMAVFPELGFIESALLIFTIALMVNSWINGQVQYLSLLCIAQFVSLIIALNDTYPELTGLDLFCWSTLLTGMTAMTFSYLHQNGALYKNLKTAITQTTAPIIAAQTWLIIPEDSQQKEELNDQFQIIGYLGLAFSVSVMWGLGTLIGAILLTRKLVINGSFSLLVFAPLVHGLALYNFLYQSGILSDSLMLQTVGVLLLIEGTSFVALSIKNDAVYDFELFEWDSDEVFFEFMDRLGLAGVGTTIAGIFVIFNDPSWDTFAFGLTTVVLIGVGIQGYTPEFDARWRRVVGGYGSIVTTFVTASTLSSISDTIANIGYMFGAIVTMGWIFMSSNRLGDSNDIYTPDPNAVIQHAVIESESSEPEVSAPVIPEPVLKEEEDEEEEDEDEIEVVEETLVVSEDAVTKSEQPAVITPSAPKDRVKTRHGFDIELPDDMFETILSSIDLTPHEGFHPVVSFGPRGEILLNFEPVNP